MTISADVLTIALALGALVHVAMGVVYFLWRYGPRGTLGLWLTLSWAVGLVRVLEARSPDFVLFTDNVARFVWANIILASVACLYSMIVNAYNRNFVRRME